jgi:glycosyltransferase involved in cell wall biosynthesis
MSKLDIVHVITGLRRGGAETMLVKLLESMDADRFRQSVVVLQDKGELGPRIEQAGVPVIALHMGGAFDLPRVLLRMRDILKQTKPDIVQTWLYHADFVGTLAAKTAGVSRVLWNIRCSSMEFRDYNPTTRLICGLLARMSAMPDLVVSNSLTGQKAHVELGYHPREWRILPNGFDTDRFRPDEARAAAFRQTLGIAPSTPLIGLPARLDPMKDHDNFLDAAALLANDFPAARFVLIGRGLSPENADMASRIAERGLAGLVHLLGERDDMETVMTGLDIVTLCSAYGEGFPNVLGEAMSCGKICVATDVGDSAEIVGSHGRIVAPRRPADLARAWREVLALDPQSRSEIGRSARRHVVERYSLPAVARAYEDLYLSVASSAGNRISPDHRQASGG